MSCGRADFFEGQFKDFEDLMILNSAIRGECELFVTNDKNLLELKEFNGMKIERPVL